VDDVATDGALVDSESGGQFGDGAGTAGLQDLEQGEHPGGRSRHAAKYGPISGRILSGIGSSVADMVTNTPAPGPLKSLVSIRVITDDVPRLVEFYERVTGMALRRLTPDFAELQTLAGTLAIASSQTVALFGAGSARPADNHTAIIEFLVEDVDAEYDSIEQLTADVVTEPTTMPWGNRSLLFRDPDGNLINFFTPVTPEAIAKFTR